MKSLPYGHQWIDEDDIRAVVEVLRSDFLTQGPKVKEFEDSLADYCGAKFAVVFSSGTAALHASYFAAGLGREAGIITSPITFMATANAALFLGAGVAFIDIEPDTANIACDLIEQAVTPKTKAVVTVHFSGHPVDLKSARLITEKYGLILIEDACHALGAKYLDANIGDCRYERIIDLICYF